MKVKLEKQQSRFGAHTGLRLAKGAAAADEDAIEAQVVEVSAADRLKGLSAAEISRHMSDKQRDGVRRKLLSEAERSPAWDQGYRAAMVRVAQVATSEHFEGREISAIELLANDRLSAAEINNLLARQPSKQDDNTALLAALRNENQDLGDYSDELGASGAPADLMKSAHAKAKERRGVSA